MTANIYQWTSEHNTLKITLGVHELDVLTILSSQVVTLLKQVSSLTTQANVIKTLAKVHHLCGGLHIST